MWQTYLVSSCSIDVHDVASVMQCIRPNVGAAANSVAPRENVDRIGAHPYICCNLCTQTSTCLCMPQEPLPNSHLNLLVYE